AVLERELLEVLAPLAEHEHVREVRAGTGVLAAVAVDGDSTLSARVLRELRGHGVLSRMLADGALQVSPPLVTNSADTAALAVAIADAVDAASRETGGGA